MPMRRYLTFANVVSLIALFVALGGGAYAVQTAKKNSVTSASIRNGAVRSVDIGRGQVRASDIKSGLLRDTTTGDTKKSVGVCVQDLTTYVSCLEKDVTIKMPGRIDASADGTADSGSASIPVGVNTCRLAVDGVGFTQDFVIAADFSPGEAFSFSGISEPVAAGTHVVSLDCRGNGTLPGARIFFPSLTTLQLGT